MSKYFFIAILLTAAFFRLYGLNWDQGEHLHPDERFLTMVAIAMKWPASPSQYLDTSHSQLNPHNVGSGFYVYGTFPVILTKLVAESLKLGDYLNLTLVGRAVSAVFDLGTVVLVYLITQRLFRRSSASLMAMVAYSASVLPIQLSHFFAVDTFLTFFLVLTFYFLITHHHFLLGIAYGLALSSKISAIVFAPIIIIYFLREFTTSPKRFQVILSGLIFTISCLITVRLAYPYLFQGLHLNPLVLANWTQLKSFDDPHSLFPPAIQWIHIPHFLFPLENILYWGLGLPLGLISLVGITYLGIKHYRHPYALLLVFWTILVFIYQGLQFAQPLRYFYPIFPFLAIASGLFISDISQIFPRPSVSYFLFGILFLVWPLSFMRLYSRPHTRVTATNWILNNIPAGSTISCEHWDDCLPLHEYERYRQVEFPLYHPDSPAKWKDMSAKLARVDYIILSSNRLYGSIMTVPERYPQTFTYYQSLFDGSLDFVPVAQFTSRPNLPIPGLNLCITPANIVYGKIARLIQNCPLPGISIVDDYAEELFTVYDHPKVIIFRKDKPSNDLDF